MRPDRAPRPAEISGGISGAPSAAAAPALESLAAQWRAQAAELRSWGGDSPAKALERAAKELDAALEQEQGVLLPLAAAADVSGYAADSLRHLARAGKLTAVRRGRRLFFRAGDLPRKPPPVDGPALVGYDPRADARLVAGQRQQGET
ncbi:MAG TPA: hypothetical protein VFW89_05375 [Gemmatimonadaceae bacterium]|nr:hypothetical protein [Gemmatimonadaceae bacterium]